MSVGGDKNKSVKAALKEARELIEKKEFKAALRCCKKALNVEKDNYMALVFCGLCLSELDQPEQAVQVRISTLVLLPNFVIRVRFIPTSTIYNWNFLTYHRRTKKRLKIIRRN